MNEVAQDDSKEKKVGGRLSFILAIFASIYVAFLLYQAVFLNYQTNQKIRVLKSDLGDLKQDQARLGSLIAYYKTGAFQELEARKKLGLKMPGEKVIPVKVEEEQNAVVKIEDQVKNESFVQNKSNAEKWLDYLKGREI